MTQEYLHIREATRPVCELHDVPTPELPNLMVKRMRETQPKGIDVCRDCVTRASDEAKRRKDARNKQA